MTVIGPTFRSMISSPSSERLPDREVREGLSDGDRGVASVVDPPPVGCPPHLRGHLVQGQVEGAHLVVGRGLRPDDRALGEGGQLYVDCLVVLSWIGFAFDLHVHPDDPVVVLLEFGQLLRCVLAKPVRDLTMTCGDHNFHANLLLMSVGCPWTSR